MAKRVLFITEGEVDELTLMESICRDLGLNSDEHEFYSYRTDFHQFAKIMLPDSDECVDEDLDILLTLKSHEQDAEKRKILTGKYTDIFIIFDLDPHAKMPEFDKIHALVSFFIDSSNMGRLFVNYPMMQSYKHLKHLPDMEYENRMVTMQEIRNYKDIVSHEGLPELIGTHDYNHVQLYEIAYHNYCKREKILGRNYAFNTPDSYNSEEDIIVLEKQLKELRDNEQCSVLNTSSLTYMEYRPKEFINEIQHHRNRFCI